MLADGSWSEFGTLELIIPRLRLLTGLVELVWLLSFTTTFLCESSPKTCRSTGASSSEAQQRSSARLPQLTHPGP